MGTCCAACLPAKVRDYASNAKNGAVTVTLIKNPPQPPLTGNAAYVAKYNMQQLVEVIRWRDSLPKCDICGNIAKFLLTFF